MMRVYLIRHGQAEDAATDPARPLSRQGREDVTRVAGFLSLFERPQPQRIAHSGKLRAQQTAGMFAEAWQVDDVREMPDLLPMADPAAWASRLASLDGDMALVGHLPHLGRLAGLMLCGDAGHEVVHLQAAAVACLERSEAGWTVLWHLHPGLFYGRD
jgi:phosphohistidine phosphatase